MSVDKNYSGTKTADVAKGEPGQVHSLVVRNLNTAFRFFQLHDKTTAPTSGNAAAISVPIPPNSMVVLGEDFFREQGVSFSHGVAWGYSTALATFTAATAADHDHTMVYS